MKHKTNSGIKKRVKVRPGGTLTLQKSCKNHLFSGKSKRQRKAFKSGMPIDRTNLHAIKQML